MTDLLASNESVFHGVNILSVEELDSNTFSVTTRFVAAEGKWFAPSCDQADADGWVTAVESVVGEITFALDNAAVYKRFVTNLIKWRNQKTELHGVVSEKTSTLGFYNPKVAMNQTSTTLINLESIASNN